ncbi:helix-turn-helix domain-containing protein [Ancylobacter sp. WKF20]|uniref:helix-turn-helix domain-containing protein n=1 Tax=Ancylobacter sp. WKF20 TaxID=3039801 RepID=UPI00243437F6|nr:helix-turn-helix domain-containing protein [Ancylobacter sp. WKF20]WGD31028.1 helix-turn-helix domain-containing protein [Ancylobacter sp. WKF20]
MHPILFTTASLPPHQQFGAFRVAHEAIMDIVPPADGQTSFAMSQRIWPLGRLVLTSTSLPRKGHPVRWTHLPKGVLDHWYVVLPCRFDEAGLAHPKPEARPCIHSLARPLTTEIEDDGVLTLFVPRNLLADSCLDNFLDVPLANGPGTLLGDLMLALDRRLPLIEPHDIDHLVEATRCFLNAVAQPSPDHVAESQAPIDLALLERARRLIRQRLTEPALTPDAICKELGVSRSRLYRLFEPIGGISAYVRRQRLLAARHALLNPMDVRPITRIAEHWGFPDASVFSRTFRHEFGVSPKDAREACRMGRRGIGGLEGTSVACSHMPSLADLLRRLAA